MPDESVRQDEQPVVRPPGPRSLFALMQRSEHPPGADRDATTTTAEGSAAAEDVAAEAPRDTGRIDTPRRFTTSPAIHARDEQTRRNDHPPTRDDADRLARDDADEDTRDDADDELHDDAAASDVTSSMGSIGLSSLTMEAIEPGDLEPSRITVATAQARRQARFGLWCGIVAILSTALSLLPNFLTSLPATALGFVAIISCYLALTGAGRREISKSTRGLCLFGMLLGTTGIFLGPLFIAGLGRNFREAGGQQVTRQHLQLIGEGLDRHYTQHDGYPIGGAFARNDAGVIVGQHGWMTFLLPFVGESNLYQQIDQSKAFDDPVNRNAMGRNVSLYFAAGGDRARIGDGFAVSHFAGLGGEVDDAKGLSHLGIFERDVAVKRDEILDGLSNTLIVGELAGPYPPWGDPENWRKIGRGLNRDVNGFGSYGGQGATFLLADGSVKFFTNKTDPKLLEQMSTRDGGE